ncbi:hypothetical protein P618_200840 [Holospora obtusa F1]|uniref:Uncharacterized protein n=1 Tax=Holospora obtusa F1 TaxID=1399147 RepID=W6TT52_HOLOB|nr:hypothetical protein [Holospora obtusa]ETZ06942.1 hypothetical protein P618_200840 [Holospora obtusa F1]
MKCGIFFKKVKNSELSKPLIVAHGELLPGLQGIVVLQLLHDFTKKSNISKIAHFILIMGMLFLKSLPKNRHSIEKSGTVCIEQDNSNTKTSPRTHD